MREEVKKGEREGEKIRPRKRRANERRELKKRRGKERK